MEKTFNIKRRTFLKGAVVTGTLVGMGEAMPKFSLDGLTAKAETATTVQTFQSACPRNCYSTCSMLSTVEDGVLKFVQGNPANTYTHGAICSKGNSYPNSVYSPDRIKYPMRQKERGSGKWERISWDEAFTTIAKKILEIKKEYGSTLPICLNKYSGNFNIMNYGIEGMLSSIGFTSRATGTPCWPAGIDAQTFDFGTIINNDPEDFVHAKYMILWGTNGAWTAMQTMKFIEQAKENGCRIIAIDPILTATAAKAHMHIQIKPSTDGALALGMARYILDHNLHDQAWLDTHALGYNEFFDYLRKEVTLEWASEKTGIPVKIIEQIAHEYATTKPANIWIGYGMQRHVNGGHNVRAIDALVAMTGNVGISGGGANYAQLETWGFNYYAQTHKAPEGSAGEKDRAINMNNFAQGVLDAKEPPIKMLWMACRNSGQQDPDSHLIEKMFESMDLVVTADLFFNKTVQMSDIVLPVTTLFESPGVMVSYWHYWVTVNEQAIQPMYEAKHDIEIAMGLSAKMNELEPGSCTYPTSGDLEEWLGKEFNEDVLAALGISDWKELKQGPKKMKDMEVAWKDGQFRTPSGKYEFLSTEAEKFGHTALPKYKEELKPESDYPIRCISPHWKMGINGQFQNLDWMQALNNEPFMEIHPNLAKKKGIKHLDQVKVYNDQGEVTITAKITKNVPEDVICIYEMWLKDVDFQINNTVKAIPADMGEKATGMPGIAFHDNFVNLKKA